MRSHAARCDRSASWSTRKKTGAGRGQGNWVLAATAHIGRTRSRGGCKHFDTVTRERVMMLWKVGGEPRLESDPEKYGSR